MTWTSDALTLNAPSSIDTWRLWHVTPGPLTPKLQFGHLTPGHVTPRHMTPKTIFGHLTPGHMTPYLFWTCDAQDKYWTPDAQTYDAQKFLDTWRPDIWRLDMWCPTQYIEWALNGIEITFYRTFTGWKSMHQGFRIYFVWNPRLMAIETAS